MKNKLKHIFMVLVLCLITPITMFLSACGATPSNEVRGVAFNSLIYEEDIYSDREGTRILPVFEVDLGVETALSYSVFPSSSSGYKISFEAIYYGTGENKSRFNFVNGKITIIDNPALNIDGKNFEPIVCNVRVKDYTDECIVRLKKYPTQIKTDMPEITISAYESYAIDVKADFINALSVETTRSITEKEYNFLVEAEDETLIKVPNKNRLKFYSIRNSTAQTKVTVTLLDQKNNPTDLKFDIVVNIVQNAGKGFLLMEDVGPFIEDGDEIELNYNLSDFEDGTRDCQLDLFILNTRNILIESDLDFTIQLSNKKHTSVASDGKTLILTDDIVDGGYKTDVVVYSGFTTDSGSLFTIKFSITVKVSS